MTLAPSRSFGVLRAPTRRVGSTRPAGVMVSQHAFLRLWHPAFLADCVARPSRPHSHNTCRVRLLSIPHPPLHFSVHASLRRWSHRPSFLPLKMRSRASSSGYGTVLCRRDVPVCDHERIDLPAHPPSRYAPPQRSFHAASTHASNVELVRSIVGGYVHRLGCGLGLAGPSRARAFTHFPAVRWHAIPALPRPPRRTVDDGESV
ncbi:hypothetical protein K438DRAFT_1116513 [Mycena galopus ATCC 62051]|nr:hypothetical protein K438DRAFT_1116513 [Mycena galopus ATCC 62051]